MFYIFLLYIYYLESVSLQSLVLTIPMFSAVSLSLLHSHTCFIYEANINTRISRPVTIVTWCHNCDAVCHNCDILFVKMLELGSEIIPKN